MSITKNILVLIFTSILTTYGLAQFKTAVVGIDGLTCSACSNATKIFEIISWLHIYKPD
jgi:hypothetical protein